MTAITTSHVVLDDCGRAYVEGTRTRITMIVMDQMNGLTPEQIHEQYPYLTLSKIHSALAYYYDHKQQLDAEIEQEAREVAELRAQAIASGTQPSRAELERRSKERQGRP